VRGDADPLAVCLEREAKLEAVVLRWRDRPGFSGPLVVLAESFDAAILASLAPRVRLIALDLPTDRPYQSQAYDVAEFLHQHGFADAVLLGLGVGAVIAQLAAAWFSKAVAGVLLVDPVLSAPGLLGRSLRDAPPRESAFSADCPVRTLASPDPAQVQAFLVELNVC
jgi:pimeloyl-ACP methyl ester carboxylesterase